MSCASSPPCTRYTSSACRRSVSRRAVLRAIQYAEVPPGQAEYVTCLRGATPDAAIDLRTGRPRTDAGKWCDGTRGTAFHSPRPGFRAACSRRRRTTPPARAPSARRPQRARRPPAPRAARTRTRRARRSVDGSRTLRTRQGSVLITHHSVR
ncbi:dTDP-4-dehydrorhamnose 3,5-epimerase family protein [Streptomyces sp. CB02058]|uniref:dTDP-4-dehydrorhamnose 3,5-epimerase family protein n=2 Tax=unclassified Streptomyces TaxID=2593676 RepID=UPI003FD3C5E1